MVGVLEGTEAEKWRDRMRCCKQQKGLPTLVFLLSLRGCPRGPALRRTEAWPVHVVEPHSPGNQRDHLTRRGRLSGPLCRWSRSQTPNAHRMVPFVQNSGTGQVRRAAEQRLLTLAKGVRGHPGPMGRRRGPIAVRTCQNSSNCTSDPCTLAHVNYIRMKKESGSKDGSWAESR